MTLKRKICFPMVWERDGQNKWFWNCRESNAELLQISPFTHMTPPPCSASCCLEESVGAFIPLVSAEEDSTHDGTLHKDSALWTIFLAAEAAYASIIPVCW